MATQFKQVYVTTNLPDKQGNYYYPAFVPADAVVQMPLTENEPPVDKGGRGLKYDWTTNKWIISNEDPINQKLANIEAMLQTATLANNTSMAGLINANNKNLNDLNSSDDASDSKPASSADSSASSVAMPDVSNMDPSALANLLNNPDLNKGGNK